MGDFGDVFHTHVPELRAIVDRLGLVERVRFTGFVPDGDLAYLLTRAQALVMPSLMEGFGLPAVEAMACGTPVVASTYGALPEVVGDAGVLVDPVDVGGDRERGCGSLLDDPGLARSPGRPLSLERATLFTWEAVARSLLAVFDEIDPTRAREARRRTA